MAKNKKEKTAVNSNKIANIVVGIVSGIAALIIIAVIVLCAVRINPLGKITVPSAEESVGGVRCDLYNLGGEDPLATNDAAQSKIRSALDSMDFSVMSAVLRWQWDYSYNFERDDEGEKVIMGSGDINSIHATETEYMVEIVYKAAKYNDGVVDTATCQSLKVDGETIYFDRIKIIIGNSDGNLGEITMYPYLYRRVTNFMEDGGISYSTYETTAVKIRANTTTAYAALGDLVTEIARGTV